MNKKRFTSSLLAIASSTLLIAGCSSGGSSGEAAPAEESAAYQGPVGDTAGTINILAWPGYAEDGSTDPAVDWVTPFEKESGCQVRSEEHTSELQSH